MLETVKFATCNANDAGASLNYRKHAVMFAPVQRSGPAARLVLASRLAIVENATRLVHVSFSCALLIPSLIHWFSLFRLFIPLLETPLLDTPLLPSPFFHFLLR